MPDHSGTSYQPFVVSETATERKIKSFGALKDGWHFGAGIRFSPDQINRAIVIHHLFVQLGITTTDAFPGMAGEISVTGYKNGRFYLEYTVVDNDTASLVARDGKKAIRTLLRQPNVQVQRELVKVVGEIWNTYGLLTRDSIMIGEGVESIETRWEPGQTEESRYSLQVA